MIYSKKEYVDAGLINAETNLSVLGAFRIVEDAITEMMAQLKIDGLTAKKCYNAMWVFAKNRIKLIKPLKWGESYTVESFITEFSVVKLNIEIAIRNAYNDIVVYARTELCALDLETGRIRKTSTVGVNESIVKEPSLMAVEFTKFDKNIAAPQIDSVKVRSTNIDFAHHTNNVEYVRFLLNTYSVDELSNLPVKEIEFNYVNQSHENDELKIYKTTDGNKDTLIINKDGNTVVRCEILR